MSAYIKTLKNAAGDIIYPQTTTAAVYTADGHNIEEYFGKADAVQLQGVDTSKYEKFWRGTKAEYDAITTKDPDIFYIITDENDGDNYSSEKGAANGVATLGSDGKLLTTQMPSLTDLGAAPSGYGYGDHLAIAFTDDTDGSKFTAAVDAYTANDAQDVVRQLVFQDHPYLSTTRFIGTMWSFNSGAYVTIFGTTNEGRSVQRLKLAGVWKPWEWVDPPMVVGVEYRTTERNGGKPVYAKTVATGALTAPETVTVAHGITDSIGVFISIEGHDNSGRPFSFNSGIADIKVDTINITIKLSSSYQSTVNSWCTLKYTKTAD